MCNNKGFTLVELISMLLVLSILMAITVPNITGILNQQKETAFVDTAERLISTAEMKILTNRKIKNPKDGNCIIMSMDYLDKGHEIKKPADDGEYVREDSYVMIVRTGQKIQYYIRLVEIVPSGEYYGLDNIEKFVLAKEKTNLLGELQYKDYKLNTATIDTLKFMEPFITTCTEIEEVYK